MKTHIDIELDGRSYRLVPSPELFDDLLARDLDPMQLGMAMREGARLGRIVPTRVQIQVLHRAMHLAGHDLPEKAFRAMCFRYGLVNLLEPFAEVISGLVHGGEIQEVAIEDDSDSGLPNGGPANRAVRRQKKALERKAGARKAGKKSGSGSSAG